MERNVLSRAAEFIKAQRRKKRWTKAVSAMAAVVVFCTTYALILPAITLQAECGKEEHTHSDACYTVETVTPQPTMLCSMEALREAGLHEHDDGCYDDEDQLICGFADFVVHAHDKTCYDLDGKLICTLEEIEEHQHDRDCYTREKTLVCQEPESDGHRHDDGCYEQVRGDLICTSEEEDHEHSDDCYEWSRELICDQEETQGHSHSGDCYETERVLDCDKPEVELHEHDEDCYDDDGVLTCGKVQVTEHVHGDDCIQPPEGEPYEVRTLTCGKEEHEHAEACYLTEPPVEEPVFGGGGGNPEEGPDGEEPDGEEPQEDTFALTAETESGIQVTVSGPVESLPYPPEEITLTAEEITSGPAEALRDQALEEAGLTARQSFLFDVSLWHEETLVEPTGPVTLTFGGLPFAGESAAKVYHIDEEAEEATDMNAARDEDDNVVLDTEHFSLYGVSLLAVEGTDSNEDGLETVMESDGAFVYTDGSTGLTVTMTLENSHYVPASFDLVVDRENADNYTNALNSFTTHGQVIEEAAIYKIYLVQRDNNQTHTNLNCAYTLEMSWQNGLFERVDSSDFLNFTYCKNPGSEPTELSNCQVTYREDGNVTALTAADSYYPNSAEFIFVRSSAPNGLTAGQYKLTYNEAKDAFLTDPAYSQYYNSNSPIGTAGSFHIVAFDSANLNAHTNGNVLARDLYAGANFGTSNLASELSYIVISATHVEAADGASATTTLSSESNVTNTIENKTGATLPETGGIGTTIFYVVGGILVIGAGVVLVTKKRMG